MNTIIGWIPWLVTCMVSVIYVAVTIGFVSADFACVYRVKQCQQSVAIFNSGIKGGSFLASISALLFVVYGTMCFWSGLKRLHGVCIGASFHLFIIMFLYSIILHTNDPIIVAWSSNKMKTMYRMSYAFGYLLAGTYGCWFVYLVVMKYLKKKYKAPVRVELQEMGYV